MLSIISNSNGIHSLMSRTIFLTGRISVITYTVSPKNLHLYFEWIEESIIIITIPNKHKIVFVRIYVEDMFHPIMKIYYRRAKFSALISNPVL